MRAGLGVKLSVIIGLLVAVSLSCVTMMASHFVGEDVRITAQSNNLAMTGRSAFLVADRLGAVRSNALQLLDMASEDRAKAAAAFFGRNADVAAIVAASAITVSAPSVRLINNSFLNANELDEGVIDRAVMANVEALEAACGGEERAVNASQHFLLPAVMLLSPWRGDGKNEALIVIISMQSLGDILGSTSVNDTFMVNSAGDMLSYSDVQRLVAGENLMNDVHEGALVRRALSDTETGMARQELFGKGNERFYGAWQKLDMADIWIFTTVPLKAVTEGVDQTRRNNFYLTGVIMFLSMFFILIYVRGGITQPLGKLTAAAEEIQRGNFDTDIISTLNTKRRDEIGLLNISTQHEREFLGTFARFTNKQVAQSIAAGTLDFQPHLKDLTIFFSDIRGFTAISDGFKEKFGNNSPKEIIAFLNDYMARMVNCVSLSGGNIDKFEGDAIMGVWGILRDDSLDFNTIDGSHAIVEHQKHVVEDAINCISGVLAMRYALMQYNKEAEEYTRCHSDGTGSYKPHIRIGCGINTGRATAGLMGSEYKMEYTAIGDAVNFASRTESSNKLCGTDILITEDTFTLLKRDYIRCPENDYAIPDGNIAKEIIVEMIPVSFEVKGKGTQHFYGVVNMPRFDIEEFFRRGDESFTIDPDCARALGPSGPKTLNEVRALLGIPMPDFAKVDLNADENKIVASSSKSSASKTSDASKTGVASKPNAASKTGAAHRRVKGVA